MYNVYIIFNFEEKKTESNQREKSSNYFDKLQAFSTVSHKYNNPLLVEVVLLQILVLKKFK